MEEIWIDLNRTFVQRDTILAISNMGNMKLGAGIIKPIPLRQCITYNGKLVRLYRILAEHFIPKTEEDIALGRDYVDHITHNPTDMNVNDIRNLRWCTQKENCNFKEAKRHSSLAMKGRFTGKDNPFYGKHHSDETKKLISERAKGRKSPRKGCKLSEETKLKMSEARKLYFEKVKNANKLQQL